MASDFLTALETEIASIHANTADPAALTASVMAQVTPKIDALTSRVADLETALKDTVAHLTARRYRCGIGNRYGGFARRTGDLIFSNRCQ